MPPPISESLTGVIGVGIDGIVGVGGITGLVGAAGAGSLTGMFGITGLVGAAGAGSLTGIDGIVGVGVVPGGVITGLTGMPPPIVVSLIYSHPLSFSHLTTFRAPSASTKLIQTDKIQIWKQKLIAY